MEQELPISGRGKVAIFLAWAVAACMFLMSIFELMEMQGIVDLEAIELDTLSVIASLFYVVQFLVFIASVVAIAMWIHRAHSRLHAAGFEGLEFSPGWSVGWYFIPFANLIKPFQAMRELWNTSHLVEDSNIEESPGLLKAWWACWLIGNIVSNISMRMTLSDSAGTVSAGFLIGAIASIVTGIAAILIARIIREVTAAQSAGGFSAHAFD